MTQKSRIEFEKRISKDHAEHSKGDHDPKVVGLAVVQALQGAHIRVNKMDGHDIAKTKGTKVEESGDGPPYLSSRDRLFPVEH